MKIIFLSSKYVESDISVEFGEILPIEIPLLNKKLIYHQIESVKYLNGEIFITLPTGYKLDVEFKYTNIEISNDKNLIDVLSIIAERFVEDEKLLIYYGDSLLLDHNLIDLNKNYFFVQRAKYKYKWGKIDQNGFVPAGAFYLDCKTLKLAINNCTNFDDFVTNVLKDKNLVIFDDFKWLDFGHSLTYYNSRRKFLETREFNKIEFQNDFIIKSSNDIFKIWSEFKWLNSIKKYFPQNIPYVNSFDIKGLNANYSLEYLYHPVLSDIYVFGKQPEDFFIELLYILKNLLNEIKKINIDNEIYDKNNNFYISKLKERESEILTCVKNLNEDSMLISSLISENFEYFSKHKYNYSIMHGDFCFSNLLFNFSTFQPILIDPRGYTDKNIGNSLFGPSDYDIFKLAHSYVAGYDLVISNINNLDFFNETNFNIRLINFSKIFEIDTVHLKMGLKHLFITMLPLHKDSPDRQRGFINVLKLINKLC